MRDAVPELTGPLCFLFPHTPLGEPTLRPEFRIWASGFQVLWLGD